MTSILSIIMCFALVVSGGLFTQDPLAASGKTLTVNHIAVTIDQEEYALAPEAVFSIGTRDNSVITDEWVKLGDDRLLPVQIKVDETGVAALLGESATGYLLTAKAIEEAVGEIPEGIVPVTQAWQDFLHAAWFYATEKQEESQTLIQAKLQELLAGVETEEAEFTIEEDDVQRTETGLHFVREFTMDEIWEFYDFIYNDLYPDMGEAYWRLMDAVAAMSGEEMPISDVHSFKELFAQLGQEESLDMKVTLEGTENESCGVYTLTCEMKQGEESFLLPIEITRLGQEHLEFRYSLDQDEFSMYYLGEIDGKATDVQMGLDTPQGDGLSVFFSSDEQGNCQMNGNIVAASEGYTFNFSGSYEADGTGSVDLTVEGNRSVSIAFDFAVTDEMPEDRIAGAELKAIDSVDEVANSGIMLSAMGLAGDLEKLQNEESVQKLIAVVGTLMEEGLESYDDSEMEGKAEDLPYAMPELKGLPEGFEKTEESYYSSSGMASLIYTHKDDGRSLHVRILPYEATDYLLKLDGSRVEQPEDCIEIYRDEYCLDATATLNGLEIDLNDYSVSLTDEEIVAFFNGIAFEEAPAETPAA